MASIKISKNGSVLSVYQTVISESDDKNPSGSEMPFSFAMYDALIDSCQNNICYFERDNTTVAGERFLNAFRNIVKQLAIVRQFVSEFCGFLHEYDFDENTSANGYRSLVKAMHGMINHTIKLSNYIAENRGNLLFRTMEHVR